MAVNAAAWLRHNKAVYFDNATSVRDYRVQLRGNRSVMLFGLYLVVLIGVAMVVYSNSATQGATEVVEIQRRLKDFYGIVMGLLGGIVSLIAPALTATTIIVERQRRSLDLVFSAPVSPKYFLVGKMMSSFRYTWMLLILSLPVTAACVVLGGASWGDVLTAYVLLSLQGLALTSIALLISTVALRPVSAVIWSYGASAIYLFVTFGLSASVMFRSFSGGPTSSEAPFYVDLNPFLVQSVTGTYTTIGSVQVPNWLLVIGFTGLVCKLCLLAAGTMLSPRPEVEIRSLRIHALIYAAALVMYITWGFAGSGSFGSTSKEYLGRYLFLFVSPLCIFMPFLSTFGVDGERRYWPNGTFSVRHILDGTPSGGLPFILSLIGVSSGAMAYGFWRGGGASPDGQFLTWTFFAITFWFAFWSVGRFAASMFVGLRAARTIQFASFILLVVLPVPFLSALGSGDVKNPIWTVYPLQPLFLDPRDGDPLAMTWSWIFLIGGLLVAVAAETRTRRKMNVLRNQYAGTLPDAT